MNAAPPRLHWPGSEKPKPTMTWAEMARSEGHKPRLPNASKSAATDKEKILSVMSLEGQTSASIAKAARVRNQTARKALSELRKAGMVQAKPNSHGYLWRLA